MDEPSVDAATTWEPLPGSILFGLLLLIAIGFVLLPSEATSPFFDRWTRISPFACMYDIVRRLVEIAFLVFDRSTRPTSTDSTDILVRLNATATYLSLALRLTATISLLALLQLRYAIWPQCFAITYAMHWATISVISVHWSGTVDRSRTIDRVSGAIVAVIGHLIVYTTTAQPSPSPTWYEQDVNIATFCVIAGLGYFFADGFTEHHSFVALGCQPCALGWWAAFWLFALAPTNYLRPPLPEDATESERIDCWYLPAVSFQMGTICFLISRRSLELAHPIVKVVVGSVSLGLGAFYYCCFYYVYFDFGVSLAERPSSWARVY